MIFSDKKIKNVFVCVCKQCATVNLADYIVYNMLIIRNQN